jgi:hypothetical protein
MTNEKEAILMKTETKILSGLTIVLLIYSTIWWKNEFDVYPLETSLANYVKKDMKENYFLNEIYFDSLNTLCATLTPFENMEFHSSNLIEVTLISDGYFDSSSFLSISNYNIDDYSFENGNFISKKNSDSYFGFCWEWKFRGSIDNKYFEKYLEYKKVSSETIVSISNILNKVKCYSISGDGSSSFHYKYDKLKFLNLDYFTKDGYFIGHQDTCKLNENISIGKCYY